MKPLLLLVSILVIATSAQAQSVADYWAFSVRRQGSSFLYGFTSETTRTLIATGSTFEDVLPYRTNHLATDVTNNRIIYARMSAPVGVNQDVIDSIWAWDFDIPDADKRVNITNSFDISAIGATSGGASFYNGNYYFWDDGDASADGVGFYRFGFDVDGNIDSMTQPYAMDLTLMKSIGSLGDIAIDANGMMFVFSAGSQLYRMDLNDPLGNLIFVGDYTSLAAGNGQLFIDELGRLLTRETATGNWLSLNPNGASILENIPGAGFGAQIYDDLTEGGLVGVVAVPEPAGSLLVILSGMLVLLRRRRGF